MTKQEIIAGLQRIGLTKGDKVLLHSSLLSLGKVDGGPDAVIDAFIEVLGSEGTLLVPVFGALGILTDTLKKRPGAIISPCPVGTLAALGADAEAICHDHWRADTAHGKDTPLPVLLKWVVMSVFWDAIRIVIPLCTALKHCWNFLTSMMRQPHLLLLREKRSAKRGNIIPDRIVILSVLTVISGKPV